MTKNASQEIPKEETQIPGEFRKLDVAVRETDYVAGRENITAIVIRNTYPKDIVLCSVLARNSILTSSTKAAVFGTQKFREPHGDSKTGFRFQFPNIFTRSKEPLFEFSHELERLAKPEPILITAEALSKVSLDTEAAVGREVHITASGSAEVHLIKSQDSDERARAAQTITPMSEIVAEYTWKTTHWLLFTPSRLGLDIEIKYEVDSEVRSQVVSSTFDIKPPVLSVILGSICGGIIGSVARSLTVSNEFALTWRLAIQIAGSVLLAVIATIALSRKAGTQSFITVEDFFGAFVLGSLIGYQGTTFFEQSIASVANSAPSK